MRHPHPTANLNPFLKFTEIRLCYDLSSVMVMCFMDMLFNFLCHFFMHR